MEKVIYDFLDKTIGHEVVCEYKNIWGDNHYSIRTKDLEIEVIKFKVYGPPLNHQVRIIGSQPICKIVSSFFGIKYNESHVYIFDWFFNVHGLKDDMDILKFIPTDNTDFTYY